MDFLSDTSKFRQSGIAGLQYDDGPCARARCKEITGLQYDDLSCARARCTEIAGLKYVRDKHNIDYCICCHTTCICANTTLDNTLSR